MATTSLGTRLSCSNRTATLDATWTSGSSDSTTEFHRLSSTCARSLVLRLGIVTHGDIRTTWTEVVAMRTVHYHNRGRRLVVVIAPVWPAQPFSRSTTVSH